LVEHEGGPARPAEAPVAINAAAATNETKAITNLGNMLLIHFPDSVLENYLNANWATPASVRLAPVRAVAAKTLCRSAAGGLPRCATRFPLCRFGLRMTGIGP